MVGRRTAEPRQARQPTAPLTRERSQSFSPHGGVAQEERVPEHRGARPRSGPNDARQRRAGRPRQPRSRDLPAHSARAATAAALPAHPARSHPTPLTKLPGARAHISARAGPVTDHIPTTDPSQHMVPRYPTRSGEAGHMTPATPTRTDEIRRRQRLTTEIRDTLRELGIQLALLNHHVSARLELKDVDLDCLNLIDRSRSTQPERPRTTRLAPPGDDHRHPRPPRTQACWGVDREACTSSNRRGRPAPRSECKPTATSTSIATLNHRLQEASSRPRQRLHRTGTARRFPPPHHKRRPKRSRRTSRRLTQDHRSKPHSPAPARCPPPASALGASARSIADP